MVYLIKIPHRGGNFIVFELVQVSYSYYYANIQVHYATAKTAEGIILKLQYVMSKVKIQCWFDKSRWPWPRPWNYVHPKSKKSLWLFPLFSLKKQDIFMKISHNVQNTMIHLLCSIPKSKILIFHGGHLEKTFSKSLTF